MNEEIKDIILKIIELYENMPYLWDKDHAHYRNQKYRDDGYKVLLKVYKNVDPNATIKTIKKKIENMKTTYFREVKKVENSIQSGAKGSEVYEPSLWYFDSFTFLRSTPEFCYSGKRSASDEELLSEEENSEEEHSGEVIIPTKTKKKSRISKLGSEGRILKVYEKVQTKDEEWEIMGKSIALQMRDLEKRELTIANKLISDVIYYAKIGRLTENAYLALE